MGALWSYFYEYPEDTVIDPALGLTGRQKRLVEETWKVVRSDPVGTGVAIMTKYFSRYPKYQQVFPVFKNIPLAELPSNKKFQAHCQNIISTLGNALDSLNDPALMEATLRMVGERHGKRGQGEQEFIDLKPVIMEVLENRLRSRFTAEVKETWDKIIDAAFSKIYDGLYTDK